MHVLVCVVYVNCEACESENVSNVRICTAEIAFFFYKSNVKFAKAVRELFSVETGP